MLIFQRGFLAISRAERAGSTPSEFMQLGGTHPVRDAFDDPTRMRAGWGAVSIVFLGRFAARKDQVPVRIGRDGLYFSTGRPDAHACPPAWYPIVVPQSRVGGNAGGVRVLADRVTVLGYRPNWLGPPGGSFIRYEVLADRALSFPRFQLLRDEGTLEQWVLDR